MTSSSSGYRRGRGGSSSEGQKESLERQIISDYFLLEDETLFMDGFDDCILGVCHQFGRPPVICYDLEKVLQRLCDQGMTFEEAEEWWGYNQVGAWMGDFTPVFVKRLPREVRE